MDPTLVIAVFLFAGAGLITLFLTRQHGRRRIDSLNAQIVSLERERAEAIKDAQAADRRATEFLTHERDAHTEIVKTKDDQIARSNEFIAHAREVLTTEFKALSADAIRDVSGQLIR